ncbi:MAG: ankyrin repeat domain-containing protein, partial [Hydrogenophaga sp.]|nr:ankyrin repeat domain-containing protein [Hydrogenophaga sp.]
MKAVTNIAYSKFALLTLLVTAPLGAMESNAQTLTQKHSSRWEKQYRKIRQTDQERVTQARATMAKIHTLNALSAAKNTPLVSAVLSEETDMIIDTETTFATSQPGATEPQNQKLSKKRPSRWDQKEKVAPEQCIVDADPVTQLHTAVSAGDTKTVSLLLNSLSDPKKRAHYVNEHGKKERTALHIAAMRADAPMIDLLLTAGANILRIDKTQSTPL